MHISRLYPDLEVVLVLSCHLILGIEVVSEYRKNVKFEVLHQGVGVGMSVKYFVTISLYAVALKH